MSTAGTICRQRLADKIKPYRAGYLPEDRRQIEKELFSGALLGVVATNALELGIDIGDLEATILTGYPGSIASTWQQAGRSGRSGGGSLSVLIGDNNPLDQYFMNHPDFFFGNPYENALMNWENINILKQHLLCAAWERPLTESDRSFLRGQPACSSGGTAARGQDTPAASLLASFTPALTSGTAHQHQVSLSEQLCHTGHKQGLPGPGNRPGKQCLFPASRWCNLSAPGRDIFH